VAENPFELELRHFLSILDGAQPEVITAEDGLEAVRLAEATRRSALTGRPVRLNSTEGARR
jgi:predicted dehydrogenase